MTWISVAVGFCYLAMCSAFALLLRLSLSTLPADYVPEIPNERLQLPPTRPTPVIVENNYTISNVVVIQDQDEINRMSPPDKVAEQSSLQLNRELMVFVYGFTVDPILQHYVSALDARASITATPGCG
jgi:hypothetical protein